jgi:hypothetical protein
VASSVSQTASSGPCKEISRHTLREHPFLLSYSFPDYVLTLLHSIFSRLFSCRERIRTQNRATIHGSDQYGQKPRIPASTSTRLRRARKAPIMDDDRGTRCPVIHTTSFLTDTHAELREPNRTGVVLLICAVGSQSTNTSSPQGVGPSNPPNQTTLVPEVVTAVSKAATDEPVRRMRRIFNNPQSGK